MTTAVREYHSGAQKAGRVKDARRRSKPRGALFFAFVAVLAVAIVPFGSTGPFAGYVSTFFVALLSGVVVVRRGPSPALRALERATWLVAAGLAAYVSLQVTGAFGLLPPHPIWQQASAALGEPIMGLPAIDPAASLAALPAMLAPFIIFVSSLRLSWRDGQALIFLEAIGFLGGAVAIIGLAQFVLAPGTLLLSEKFAYIDSLTGVFINRNTAATYFGCTVLVLLTLLQWELRNASNWISALSNLIEPSERKRSRKPIIYLFLITICLLALLLTKSRAGIACSSAAILLHIALSVRQRASLLIWLTTVFGAIVATGTGLLVFGGQTIYRAEIRGVNDDRFCVLPGIWRAAHDNFPFGAGLGSFPLIFQTYRNPECGIYGVWRRAHNFFLEGSIALGLVFWVALAFCLLGLLGIFIVGLRRRRRYRIIPTLGLSTTLLLVAHDLLDFSLQIQGFAIVATAILGLCASVSLSGKAGHKSQRTSLEAPAGSTASSE